MVATRIILLITMVLYMAGCQPNPEGHEIETIKVAQFGEVFIYMPIYIAQQRGFFNEEGLKVELINTGGDDKTFAALISGSAVFGVADPTFVAIANERGQEGKVIASVVNGVPFWGITNNNELKNISDSKQLDGLSVATFPSPSTAYTLQYNMFKEANLEPNIRQAAFGALIPLLESGDVDVALELEPNVSTAVNNGSKIIYSMAEMYGDFAITGVTTLQKTIDNNPDLVQKFVNALQKAESYAHQYPDSATYYAKQKFPDMDPVVVEHAINRIIDTNTLPSSTLISEEAWEKAIQLRKDVGDIESLEKARSVLDISFASEAK